VLAHRIGPVLVAAFANSPLSAGRPTGWLSTRQATWGLMDPGRTRHPRHHAEPREAWARYALDAQLLCIRSADPPDGIHPPGGTTPPGDSHPDGPHPDGHSPGGNWSAPPGLTFRDWIRGVPGLRAPTAADLDYHLSTLFPPVRPRGWLELRMTDAQDGDDWIVATAVTARLLDDPVAADAAYAATEPLCPDGEPFPSDEVWRRAALTGLADPDLAKAARTCFAAAESSLARCDAPASLSQAVSAFAERYPERGRCPAHDQLDALSRA
jgi:glutamate--cysteine ligase